LKESPAAASVNHDGCLPQIRLSAFEHQTARVLVKRIGRSETFAIQFGFANHDREIEKLVRGYRFEKGFAKAGF
jgi:hypothetical protein